MPNAGKNLKQSISHLLLVRMKNVTVALEDRLTNFYKAKYFLSYDPALLLFTVESKDLKIYNHTKSYM